MDKGVYFVWGPFHVESIREDERYRHRRHSEALRGAMECDPFLRKGGGVCVRESQCDFVRCL